MCRGKRIWEIYVLSFQFYYKPKIALEKMNYLKKTKEKRKVPVVEVFKHGYNRSLVFAVVLFCFGGRWHLNYF